MRDNPFERRQGLNQRFVLGVLFAFGRSELLVYQSEQRIEVGRPGKVLDERTIIAQRLEQVPQVLFGKKQQRLVAQHRHVVVVDDVGEDVRLRLQAGAQALDELAVLFHVLALHHRHQLVLRNELLFVAKVVLVIFLVRTHQIVPAGVKLQPRFYRRHEDGNNKQQHLGIKIEPRITVNGIREPAQDANRGGIWRLHGGESGVATGC